MTHRQLPLPLKGPYETTESLTRRARKVLADKEPWWINNWWPNQIDGFLRSMNHDD